ncbi:tetratricopeptide repeat protein [Halomicroarcula sp. GCM10025817]|uniref:tetratricopeptide repeat protein n=1 Tax=Haloarcula TaxID=2237 RepID=UPI0023E8CEBB|nr:tetratricopeptide repeat protein [Halomicroarcula sp. SYNS111]
MTDNDPEDHTFSEGQGFGDPYEGFDLEPPEFEVDTDKVDPVDSRVLTDLLDRHNVPSDEVDADQLLEVGLEYMQINRHEQAAETFERVARYTDEERLEQEAWTNKGVAHAELEEWDAAIGAFQEALSMEERSDHAATAETNLAYALWESGRSEQALEHAERAVEIDPRFGQAWYNRGFFLLERGLAEDAVDAFDNAIRLGFRNAEILEEKARALEELGEYDRAEELAEEVDEMRQNAEEQLLE